jgi:hypothetical protein
MGMRGRLSPGNVHIANGQSARMQAPLAFMRAFLQKQRYASISRFKPGCKGDGFDTSCSPNHVLEMGYFIIQPQCTLH